MQLVTLHVVCLTGLVSACGASVTTSSRSLPTGVWGGNGIEMRVTATGARLTFDCAAGSINQAIPVNGEGAFTVVGDYSFGRGGPREPGDTPAPPQPARYRGTLDGDTLQLQVTLPGLSRTMGEFLLDLGERPRFEFCL